MKPAFVFPGQGSQYVGMGREVFDNFAEARTVFEQAGDVLGYNISRICFEGPEEELVKTSNTQPAILTVSMACFEVLRGKGVTPSAVAGHSLGEYSALVAAGALDFSDALRLVRQRARFMQECAPPGGGMAAVLGLGGDLVRKACQEAAGLGIVEVANYNCPGQIVISGESAALQKAMALCREYGAKRAVQLQVSGPFHSSLMSEAGRRLSEELANTEIRTPVCPLVSNVTAQAVRSGDEIKSLLEKQVSSSVRWEESVKAISAMGIQAFVEVGPGKVLTGLGRKIIRDGRFFNIEDRSTLEITLDNLKEVL